MNKETKKEYMKEYYKRNKEKMKKQASKWRKNNKKRFNSLSKKYHKQNNYKYEKTPEQREIRNIKRKTRHRFPLSDNRRCKLCDKVAKCHHHNTYPIKYDKFTFLCEKCHKDIHTQLNLIGGREKCFRKRKKQ